MWHRRTLTNRSPGIPLSDCIILTARNQISPIGTVNDASHRVRVLPDVVVPPSRRSITLRDSSIIMTGGEELAIRAVHNAANSVKEFEDGAVGTTGLRVPLAYGPVSTLRP